MTENVGLYRIEIGVHPKGQIEWKAYHFYEQGDEGNEPKLKLGVGAWHEDNAADVADDEYFCCSLDLGSRDDVILVAAFVECVL